MSTVPVIDPTVDPPINDGEHLASPVGVYPAGQLPRQVIHPDLDQLDATDVGDHTIVYDLPPFAYECTAGRPHLECVGQVLRVWVKRTGTYWDLTSQGVCQNVAHRTALIDRFAADFGTTRERIGATARGGNIALYSSRFPPVTVPPVVDVDTLSPLQRRIWDYLSDGGTRSEREKALRAMVDADVFAIGRTDANVRGLVDGVLAANTSACDDGKRRFLDAVFLAEPEPERRPFFPDRRRTYTKEDLDNLDVDAGAEFVSVPALIEAVLEAKAAHDLCDAGTRAFFDEFGIEATKTTRYGVDLRGPDGDRHQALSFSVTLPFNQTLDDTGYCDGDVDTALNDALREYLRDSLGIEDDQLEIHKGFDTYNFEDD